jgi:hypothetical protein
MHDIQKLSIVLVFFIFVLFFLFNICFTYCYPMFHLFSPIFTDVSCIVRFAYLLPICVRILVCCYLHIFSYVVLHYRNPWVCVVSGTVIVHAPMRMVYAYV